METIMRNFTLLMAFILSLAFATSIQARDVITGWSQSGMTSYYNRNLNGNKTASGERYNHLGAMTAAHRSLPFGTKVRVTDRNTGNSIVVRINDRGPFYGTRVLDLSGLAAQRLGIVKQGVSKVDIEVISTPKGTTTNKQSAPLMAKSEIPAFTKLDDLIITKGDIDTIGLLIASDFRHY